MTPRAGAMWATVLLAAAAVVRPAAAQIEDDYSFVVLSDIHIGEGYPRYAPSTTTCPLARQRAPDFGVVAIRGAHTTVLPPCAGTTARTRIPTSTSARRSQRSTR